MGPIIGNDIVVPHRIKRVRIVKEVIVIISGILRHLPLFIACSAEEEELVSIVG